MINIQNTQIVDFDGGENSVTVYFDFDPAAKKMYVVPLPQMVYASGGEPVFSLTKYKTNKGNVSGVCYFDVELKIPENARKAVQAAFPDHVFGQFDWTAAESFFSFDVAGELMEIAVTPSMYGSNRVTFSVEITSDEMLQTFINAFHAKDSRVSPFHVQYNVTALAKLTGVSVTVSYDAAVAVAFESQIDYKKDTWGNTKAVVVGVKKNLKQSGAGKVLIDWKIPKTPELEMKITDWAWTTLEKAVAQAVDVAQAAATGNVPVESTSSFLQTFQENQVVDWVISTNDALTRFDDVQWQKVYHEVDLRQLVVNFNTLGIFTEADGAEVVSKVDITVDYPGREPYTFSLIPSDNQKNSFVYVAPGDFSKGNFNSTYSYKYEVFYIGKNSYVSEVKTSSDTIVTINPSLLGIRNVTFIGSDIPFTGTELAAGATKTVDKLIIDFYFTRPDGVPNKVEQKVMTGNDETQKQQFTSFYNLPLENTYTYRYMYQYNDNTIIIIEATQGFGSENRDQLLVLYPYQKQEFTLKVRKPKAGGDSILEVDVTVQYKDLQNQINDSTQYSWAPDYSGSKAILQSTPWEFYAPDNYEAAYYELNGDIIYDEDVAPLNKVKLPATKPSLLLDATQIPYTITIDPRQVDWTKVDNVLVNLFELEDGAGVQQPLLNYYFHPLPAGEIENKKSRQEVFSTTRNVLSYSLLEPAEKQKGEPRYYNIQRPRSSTSLSFYISAEYIQKDGSRTYLDETKIENKTIISLPSNGKANERLIVKQTLELPEAVASKYA